MATYAISSIDELGDRTLPRGDDRQPGCHRLEDRVP